MMQLSSKVITGALPDCCNFQLRDTVLQISPHLLANAGE